MRIHCCILHVGCHLSADRFNQTTRYQLAATYFGKKKTRTKLLIDPRIEVPGVCFPAVKYFRPASGRKLTGE